MAFGRKRKAEEGKPATGPGLLTVIRRFFQSLVIIALILYAGGLALGRTEGLRTMAEEYLAKQLGLPVKIKQARTDWRFNLTLRGVATEGNGQQHQPAARADCLRVEWDPLRSLATGKWILTSLTLQTGAVTFATTLTGQWEPAPLAPLGGRVAKWLGMDVARHVKPGAVSPMPVDDPAGTQPRKETGPPRWGDIRLSVQSGRLAWWTEASNQLAHVDNISLRVTPCRAPNRDLVHYLFNADRAEANGGFRAGRIKLEIIDAGDQQLVLLFNADREAERPAGY